MLEPKILSSSMNLNALAVLISLFAGLKLFGVVGVFLGPLILVIFVIFIDIGVVRDLADFVKYGFKEDENIRNDGDKHLNYVHINITDERNFYYVTIAMEYVAI